MVLEKEIFDLIRMTSKIPSGSAVFFIYMYVCVCKCTRKTICASISRGFTFLCTCVSGETVRLRHDLSHPARTKKQIDASSHYNSLPLLLSLRRAMLYPPGIARQIKHHLLSERVDLDLTAPSTAGGCVDNRDDLSFTKGAPCASISAEHPSSMTKTIRARSKGEKICRGKGLRGSWITRPRVTVCAPAILHTIARTGIISGRFAHPFTYSRIRNSNDIILE